MTNDSTDDLSIHRDDASALTTADGSRERQERRALPVALIVGLAMAAATIAAAALTAFADIAVALLEAL